MKKKKYYFVANDFMGQRGTYIETVELTKEEFEECEQKWCYNGRRGFITKDYVDALYYTQD